MAEASAFAAERELVGLLRDCGVAEAIAQRVASRAPFPDLQAVCAAVDLIVSGLADGELLSALQEAPPPEIGGADEGTREAARLALELYRHRFGYPYVSGIVTPTAEELLMRVRIRLGNEPAPEWRAAREHLRRWIRMRLTRRHSVAAPRA